MKVLTVVFLLSAAMGSSVYAQVPLPSPSPIISPAAAALPNPATPESQGPFKDKKLKYSLAGFYSLGSTFNFSNFTYTQGSNLLSGSGSYGTGNSYGLSAELTNSSENNWGWFGGSSYEFGRSVNSVTLNASGISATNTISSPSTVAFLVIYGGAVYRWANLYIPFGLNFNVPFMQSPAGTTGTSSFSGGLGSHLGFGYMFTDNLAFEFQLQYLTFTGSGSVGTASINLNTLTFLDPIFKLKYTF